MSAFGSSEEPEKVKVVIIGAGVSALQTARDLVEQGIVEDAAQVLILEAQDYVGGRIYQDTSFIPGVQIDLGAEIVHGSNTVLHRYAEKCNEPLRRLFVWAHGDGGPSEAPVQGCYALYYEGTSGRVYRYDETSEEVVHMHDALWGLGALEDDEVKEGQSLQDYLGSVEMSEPMQEMVAAGFSNTMCTNTKDLSLAHIASCSRIWNEEEDSGDPDADGDYKPRDSFAWLVAHLQRGLNIRLNTRVIEVKLQEGAQGVAVETADGATVFCEAVVVTAPPPVVTSGSIAFSPPLPEAILAAYASLDFNNAIKIICAFSSVPWPKNVHGMIMTGCPIPEVWFSDCADRADEPADGSPKAVCYCTGFATAGYADKLLSTYSKDELPGVLVTQLTKVFGALTPEHMSADVFHPANHALRSALPNVESVFLRGMVHDWRAQHPSVGGGYAFLRAGGSVDALKVLAKPVDDRIFFAGEATMVPGLTAHAALESGSRAAAQVAVALGVWPRV